MAIDKISSGVQNYTNSISAPTNASAQGKDASSAEATTRVKPIESVMNEAEKTEGRKVMDDETIKKRVNELNSRLNNNTECHYGIHEDTNRVTLKIVDKDSQEVLKEFPAEKTLEMITKVWELAGILVDERR